jgi:phospholipid-binding lipoprotein MlaA
VPPGPYLVLPLFGPSSFRDATSWVFAYFLTPTTYLTALVLESALQASRYIFLRAKRVG